MDKVKQKISYSVLRQKAGNDCSISPPVSGHQALTLHLSFALKMKRLDDQFSITEFTMVPVSTVGKNGQNTYTSRLALSCLDFWKRLSIPGSIFHTPL